MIDHMTVSFFVKIEPDGGLNSIIKFGSYDRLGLKDGKTLNLIRTTSKLSWHVKANLL